MVGFYLVLCVSSLPAATISLLLEVAVDISTTVALVPEVIVDTSSVLSLEEPPLPSENVQQADKKKRVISDEGEKVVPERVIEDEGDVEDFRKAKRIRVTSHWKIEEIAPSSQGAMRTSIPVPLTRPNASTLGLLRINWIQPFWESYHPHPLLQRLQFISTGLLLGLRLWIMWTY
ncbi:hypothetical protein Fot_37472 [Forsythia ovata]|uniref:Uncharacterized protein n=1 Tax=Forsythia ovata TaxID=205694 RepID=A0ABD1RZ32_9LAMI